MLSRKLVLALLLVAVQACGYRFVDEQGLFGPDATVLVRMFENRSNEPGLERLLADAMNEEFLRRGALRPVRSVGANGLEIGGTIVDVAVSPSAYSSVELALEDVLSLSVEVSVERRAAGASAAPLWIAERMSRTERFSASADPNVYESNKEQALRRLAAALASQIHDEIFQTF
jgi:hypothetical protein